MDKLKIEHIRVLKYFKDKEPAPVNVYEKYLYSYVSSPTARKIIKDLISGGLLISMNDKKDKRKKLLRVIKHYDNYI